jgi:putative salt-induced outer membrane protein YdiY
MPATGPWVATIAMLWFAPALVHADTVTLVGGEKLIGKVITNEKKKIVIQSKGLGRVEILRERIESIEFDAPATPSPTNAPGQPFVPPPPVLPRPAVSPTNAPSTALTNSPPKRAWLWRRKSSADEPSADWIQLKSGEWLRGRLYGMQNRKLDFESDELEDLTFDWKDVHQVILPRALVSYGDRQSAAGALRVDREKVTVEGEEEVTFPRFDLVGIAPGSPRELDYWSGRFNLGLNLRSGNTEQADLVTTARLERRTPRTHLKLDYVGNYSEVDKEANVDNQRINGIFDLFLTRRLFVRAPYSEFYRDPFQNIGRRFTIGGGMGYYIIDKPKVEWLVSGGPAYQFIKFDTVEANEKPERSTPAFAFQSNFDIELTKRTDLELGYQATAANENSGGVTQHGIVTLEIDLTRRLDLDISFIWDRIGNPQTDSSGNVPRKDDYRLNLSVGLKF